MYSTRAPIRHKFAVASLFRVQLSAVRLDTHRDLNSFHSLGFGRLVPHLQQEIGAHMAQQSLNVRDLNSGSTRSLACLLLSGPSRWVFCSLGSVTRHPHPPLLLFTMLELAFPLPFGFLRSQCQPFLLMLSVPMWLADHPYKPGENSKNSVRIEV